MVKLTAFSSRLFICYNMFKSNSFLISVMLPKSIYFNTLKLAVEKHMEWIENGGGTAFYKCKTSLGLPSPAV